jgi:sulfur carrier protein ThiS
MKPLTVRFVGPVRRPGPERALEVDPSATPTVGALLESLGYSPDEHRSLQVLTDGRRARGDTPLTGVESVEILIAIGGG